MTAPARGIETDGGDALVEAARALLPLVEAHRDQAERERRVPLPVIGALRSAGLFRILLPRALGGGDGNPLTAMRVIEHVSRADAAAGWNLMIGVEQAMFAGYVPETAARAVWGPDGDAITAGSGIPGGVAVVAPGGYRVTGQWPWNSGCHHADWIWGMCRVVEPDGAPRLTADGMPVLRPMLMRAGECTILDTWHVAGLRGTGSHDVAAADVYVPEERVFGYWYGMPSWCDDPLYHLPYHSIVTITLACVPLGIARAAIDALLELAAVKTPKGSARLLRDRDAVQAAVGRAEGLLRSGRAFLYETAAEAWRTALAGVDISLEQRALLRLAATQAAAGAVEAVDLMFTAAGGSAVYASSRIERCFRDVHVAVQHAQIQPVNFETVGQVFLGMSPAGLL
jgi:indole-3-acetate monooxygenase